MIRNITIKEFETLITTRVLCSHIIDRARYGHGSAFNYNDLLTLGVYATNSILKNLELSDEIWARKRGKKAFLFYERNRKILAELAIDAEAAENGVSRPVFILLGKYGYVKAKTIGDLLAQPTIGYKRPIIEENEYGEQTKK